MAFFLVAVIDAKDIFCERIFAKIPVSKIEKADKLQKLLKFLGIGHVSEFTFSVVQSLNH